MNTKTIAASLLMLAAGLFVWERHRPAPTRVAPPAPVDHSEARPRAREVAPAFLDAERVEALPTAHPAGETEPPTAKSSDDEVLLRILDAGARPIPEAVVEVPDGRSESLAVDSTGELR